MKLKRTASLLMSSALIASALGMSAFAANDVSAPGAGTTPVTVTAEASTFNVTVPTGIPLAVKADGSVTVPENVEIINNSSGPVKVTSVAMNNSAWSMTDYNGGSRAKIAAEKAHGRTLREKARDGRNQVSPRRADLSFGLTDLRHSLLCR